MSTLEPAFTAATISSHNSCSSTTVTTATCNGCATTLASKHCIADKQKDAIDKYISVDAPYCAWNTDVNLLSPIPSSNPPPPEDRMLDYYYNILQYMLYEIGFPETVDETDVLTSGGKWRPSEYGGDTGVTIAVLSNPFDVISLLIEGGRQCPGDLLLVLSMTWVEKRKPTASDVGDDKGLYRLYVRKAIAFMQNGRSALRVYNPPRRVTYCVNFFVMACTDFRNDGCDLEVDLDCTVTQLCKLTEHIDDKLWTRIKASEVGIHVPETLAFSFRSRFTYDCTLSPAAVNVIQLKSKDESENSEMILAAVEAFVNSPIMRRHQKVVVKGSGMFWCGSLGITFHDRWDVSSVASACINLLKDIREGDAILVETFCQTLKPPLASCSALTESDSPNEDGPAKCPHSVRNGLAWAATDDHACRFRSTVCRGLDGKAHMTKLVCGIACRNLPVNGDNSVGQTLESTLIAFGVLDSAARARVYDDIRAASEKVMTVMLEHEKSLTLEDRGGSGAQTDLVGIDFILVDNSHNKSDACDLVPVLIEANGLNCTCNCDLYEFMYRETSGETFERFFEHAIGASQRRQLKGRTVVVFGGDVDFLSRAAQDYKMHVINVVESKGKALPFPDVKRSAFYNHLSLNHSSTESLDKDDGRAIEHLLSLLHHQFPDRKIDGCFSLDPRLVAICSALGSELGLVESSLTRPSAAQASLDVMETQRFIATRSAAIPQWPPSYLYSLLHDFGGSLPVEKPLLALLGAADELSFADLEDLVPLVKQIHRVSVVIHRRRLLGGFVSDYIPASARTSTHLSGDTLHKNGYINHVCNGFHGENEAADEKLSGSFRWPTVLPDDKRDQLIIAAYQCVNELDLVSGLFTVDMTFNAVSPKLLRVVPCLDAASSEVNLLRSTSGVDLFVYAALIACDLKPILPVDSSFQNHLRARRPNFGHRAFDLTRLSALFPNRGNIS